MGCAETARTVAIGQPSRPPDYPRSMRIIAALLLASVCFGANEHSNRRAPGFSLPDSNFRRYDLQDYRGKWVLLDFMLTECPHCKALSQKLEEVKKKYAGKVAVLSVVIAPPENQATVSKYLLETKTTSPILFDQGQMTASYFEATPARSSFDTPHLFVIDPTGKIVRDWGRTEGPNDFLESPGLMKELDALLK